MPTVCTASYKSLPIPFCCAAAIQLQESLICERLLMGVASMLVMASAIAMRALAAEFSMAIGVRSPMLMASP